MSLRARLLLALGVAVVAALLVADVATYSKLRTFLLNQVDQNLQAAHMPVEAALTGGQGGPGGHGGHGGQDGSSPQPGASFAGSNECNLPVRLSPQTYLQIRSGSQPVCNYLAEQPNGSATYSPRLPEKITGFSVKNDPGGEPTVYFNAPALQPGGPEFRVRASELSNGQQLILAVPLSETYDTLHHLLFTELAVTAAALVLAGLIGAWLVHLGLRPLRAIERTAGAIAQGDMGHRVPGENRKTEVGRLAVALNVMLGRIQQAFSARDATETALRQSEGRLRRFVADASHELRTPVAAVSAYAELFERGAENRPEDLARVMTGIRGETARMGHLVEDLLLLARLDESRPIERSPVDLVDVATQAVEAAQAVGPEWQFRVDAAGPVIVSGDASRLRQVFDNLLSNVRAHTPPGTTATLTIARTGDEAVCRVADNGPGIRADDADRLFERFFRADPSRSRTSGGAGLGLSIVAAIVAAHGGTVAAAAAPAGEHGAVFTIRMPAVVDQAQDTSD
jgi:two-component system OmpR family sensor kinase